MKLNKILLIIQTVGMYVMHLPLYVFFILFFLANYNDTINAVLLITFFALLGLMFPLCIFNGVVSFISAFKGKYNPSKTTMIVKLVLIPWYVLNFYLCIITLAGFLNPMLLVAIPVLVVILMSTTYIYMISTSLPDIAYFFNQWIRRKIKISFYYVLTVIFLHIFCVDIAGGIMFYLRLKKNQQPTKEDNVIDYTNTPLENEAEKNG